MHAAHAAGCDADMEARVAKSLADAGASVASRNARGAVGHFADAATHLRNAGRFARALEALRPALPLLPSVAAEGAPDLVGQIMLQAVDLHRLSGDAYGGLALFRTLNVHELAPALLDRVGDVLVDLAKALEPFDAALGTELRLEAARHAGKHGTPTQVMDMLKAAAHSNMRADLWELLARHLLAAMPLFAGEAKTYFLCALAIRYGEEMAATVPTDPTDPTEPTEPTGKTAAAPVRLGRPLPPWVAPWVAAGIAGYVAELPEDKRAKFHREGAQLTEALQDVVNGVQPAKPFADKHALVVHILVVLHGCVKLEPRKPAGQPQQQPSRRGRRRGGGWRR